MRLWRDGGIPVGGGTPTRSALEKAQQALIDTFANDPLYNCLRNYGVILVTDGESNICNDFPSERGRGPRSGLPPGGRPPPPSDTWKLFPPGSPTTSGT